MAPPRESSPGGFRIDMLSERAGKALIASGWKVAAGFDADCTMCGGTGDWDGGMGPVQCVCGGLLWFPPDPTPLTLARSEAARWKAKAEGLERQLRERAL